MMDLEVLPEGVLIHALQEYFVPGGVLALLLGAWANLSGLLVASVEDKGEV